MITRILRDKDQIENYVCRLLLQKNNYIGISRKEYEFVASRYNSRALLIASGVTDIGQLANCFKKDVRVICGNENCSAILKIETHPDFLRMPDLALIVDSMAAGGIQYFRNCIGFNGELKSKTANVELFLFHGAI